VFAGDQLCGVTLNAKSLREIRKRKLIVGFGVDPDMTQFWVAMGFINGGVLRGDER
jgi:hypothetical protein